MFVISQKNFLLLIILKKNSQFTNMTTPHAILTKPLKLPHGLSIGFYKEE